MSGSESNGWIILRGASGNNLRAIDVAIPRGLFTCVTGVSGSGKSTLVQDTLFPRLMYEVYGTRTTWASHESLEGFEGIDKVIDIDQSPIGRTPRSNPALPLERSERGRSVSAANGVRVCEAAHRHLRHDP